MNHPPREASGAQLLKLWVAVVCVLLAFARADSAAGGDSLIPVTLSACLAHSPGVFAMAAASVSEQSQTAKDGDEAKALEFFNRLDAGRVAPSAAKGLEHIRILDLSHLQLRDDDLENLAHVFNLNMLDLSYTSISDRGLRTIEHLQRLDILNLAGTKMTGAGLASIGRLAHVAILHLDGTDALGGLGHLKSMRSLEILSLRDATVSENDLAQLRGLRLEQLDVTRTGTNGQFLKAFKEPRRMANLTLRENKSIDNQTCGYLLPFANLVELNVAYTGINDDGLATLSKLYKLRELDIGGTAVGDHGLESLKALARLSTLNLEATKVSDAGIDKLRPLKQLQSLTLRDTRISDAACTALRQFAFLKTVDLRGTRISEKGLTDLCRSKSIRCVVVTASVASPKTIARLQAERKGLVIKCEEAPVRPEALKPRLEPGSRSAGLPKSVWAPFIAANRR